MALIVFTLLSRNNAIIKKNHFTRTIQLKFNTKQVLLFDLDGTLVDSAPDLALAINAMLKTLEKSTFSEDTIRSWVGNGAQVLVQRALSGAHEIAADLDEEDKTRALAIFLDSYQANVCVNTVLYPDVRSTLVELKRRGYRLVIVTNKPHQFVEPILAGLRLDGLFELILGGDSLSKRKPDPMPLNYVSQLFEAHANECLMIGDSKNDILAAKAAQMESVGLTYGYNYGEDIAQHQPELVLTHFVELLDAL